MHPAKRTTTIPTPVVLISFLGLSTALFTGCTVDHHAQGDGENVRVATPFGGVSVKTDDSVVVADTGLPQYPGAQIVPKHSKDGKDSHDTGAADVNMNFGGFQLRVKSINYRTSDGQDKVLAFYRQELARYGTVIECANHQPVGTPIRTPEGLDCTEDGNQHPGKVDADLNGRVELKAGSRQHQHNVSIYPDGNGTRFDLILLDLPKHLSVGDEDSANSKNRRSE